MLECVYKIIPLLMSVLFFPLRYFSSFTNSTGVCSAFQSYLIEKKIYTQQRKHSVNTLLKCIYFTLLLTLFTSCNKNICSPEKEEVSECLGDILWNDLRKESTDYDLEIVLETIRKNSQGKREVSKNPRTILSKHLEKTSERETVTALKRAEDFLANLSSQKGSTIFLSGKLVYTILNPGNGPKVKKDSSPLMHFSEKDLDGEILYDTYKSNSPIRLELDGTILGFKLGVTGMQVGERREIVVHPDFAYKKLGKTKPNQLLIYDVTILEE